MGSAPTPRLGLTVSSRMPPCLPQFSATLWGDLVALPCCQLTQLCPAVTRRFQPCRRLEEVVEAAWVLVQPAPKVHQVSLCCCHSASMRRMVISWYGSPQYSRISWSASHLLLERSLHPILCCRVLLKYIFLDLFCFYLLNIALCSHAFSLGFCTQN